MKENRINRVAVLLVLLLSCQFLSGAGATQIGMISAGAGTLAASVDGARVPSTGTLFEGSKVSSSSYAKMQIGGGTRVNLAADSTARVYSNHALLESGSSEVQSSTGYSVQAFGYVAVPAGPSAIARVQIDDRNRVLVTAVSGPVDVTDSNGLKERVEAGATLAFLVEAELPKGQTLSGVPFDRTGCVFNAKNERNAQVQVLVDAAGNLAVELSTFGKGIRLQEFVGKESLASGVIQVNGSPGSRVAVSVSRITKAAGDSKLNCSAIAARVAPQLGPLVAHSTLITGGPGLGAAALGTVPAAGVGVTTNALAGGQRTPVTGTFAPQSTQPSN